MSQNLAMLSLVEAVPVHDGGAPLGLDLSTLAVSALIEEAQLTPKPALVDRIFDHAKRSDHTLTDAEIEALIGAPAPAAPS